MTPEQEIEQWKRECSRLSARAFEDWKKEHELADKYFWESQRKTRIIGNLQRKLATFGYAIDDLDSWHEEEELRWKVRLYGSWMKIVPDAVSEPRPDSLPENVATRQKAMKIVNN